MRAIILVIINEIWDGCMMIVIFIHEKNQIMSFSSKNQYVANKNEGCMLLLITCALVVVDQVAQICTILSYYEYIVSSLMQILFVKESMKNSTSLWQ